MKYYTLQAIVNGERIDFSKRFNSRQAAIDFMFQYLNDSYIFNKQVDDEYAVGNEHNIEYVCDYNTRFIFNRVCL